MTVRLTAVAMLMGVAVWTAAPARAMPGPGLGSSRTDFIGRFLSASSRSAWPDYRADSEPFLIEFDRENSGASVLVAATSVPEGFVPVSGLDTPSRRVLWRQGTTQTTDRSMKPEPGMPYPRNLKRYRIRDGEESDSELTVMLHELFHIHQDAVFAETVATDAVPYENAESLASLYIEHLLLARALNDGDQWRQTAKDFIALRSERRRLRPLTVEPEDYLERYEGTACYVELSALPRGQNGAAWRARTILKLMLSLGDNHRSHRPRYYPSGAAMGLLLDRAKMDWKPRVAGGDALFPLLSAALPMTTVESGERLQRVRAAYSLASLRGETAHLLAAESEQRRKALEAFRKLGRWTVRLNAPPGTAITDHVGIDVPQANFDDGTEVAVVRLFSISAGKNLKLDLQRTSMMDSLHVYDHSPKQWTPSIRFPVDADVAIKIDGKPRLPSSTPYEFQSLSIKDEHSDLVLRSPGRVSVRGRELLVEWSGR